MKLNIQEKLNLRLELYRGLTSKQRNKFNHLFSWVLIDDIPLDYFLSVTKNKKLIQKFKELKGLNT